MSEKKPAYFIFDVKIHDPEGIKPYQQKVAETYEAFGGKCRILGAVAETIEGRSPEGVLVMIEFDSLAQAHAWHSSKAYQNIVPHRLASATTHAWLVEGVPHSLSTN